MELEQAVNVIEQGLNVATKAGAFNFSDVKLLTSALNEVKLLVPVRLEEIPSDEEAELVEKEA